MKKTLGNIGKRPTLVRNGRELMQLKKQTRGLKTLKWHQPKRKKRRGMQMMALNRLLSQTLPL
jgi:hypothetical protein